MNVMAHSVDPRIAAAPLRTVKVEHLRGEAPVQKLTPELSAEAGEVLDRAREGVRLEPKQMADAMDLSHSLVLRGFKGIDHLSFHRLWLLSDDFWLELLVAIAKKRGIAVVRTTIEIPQRRSA